MGDERLADLVRERGPSLIGYAYLLTGDHAAAQDVVQEALIRTFSRRRSGVDIEWLEAYVRRAILHVYLDGYRKRRRWWGRAPALADGNGAEAPDTIAVRRADIQAALACLPPQERACIILRHVDDLSVDEVAERLGVAPGTVKRYLFDARHRLSPLLGEDDTERTDVTTVRRTR